MGTVRPSLSIGVLLVEGSADDDPSDLARARANLVQLGVAEDAAGGEVVHVAIAAQDLHGRTGVLGGTFGGVQDLSVACVSVWDGERWEERVGRIGDRRLPRREEKARRRTDG